MLMHLLFYHTLLVSQYFPITTHWGNFFFEHIHRLIIFTLEYIVTTCLSLVFKPTRPFTQAAIHWVDAGLCFQSTGCWLCQVATEPSVTWLARQPLQTGVGEGWHVLPAPVWHVNFPEPHPGCHRGLVLQKHSGVTKSKQTVVFIHHHLDLNCEQVFF